MNRHPIIDYDTEVKVYTTCWLIIGSSLIFFCLSILNYILDKLIPWKKLPGFRFFFQMLVGTILSIGSINLSYLIVKRFYVSTPDVDNFIVINLYSAAIILPLFSIYFGFQFLRDWRRSELETERLQKENAHSQMINLKNHLDPHFLFNNLNILSSLMDKDLTLSKEYLDKFAEVYRIILKAEHSDLTLLEQEMDLINSYVYLLKVRFGESVFIDIDISEKAKTKALPPLSIQMLLENAIKHNMANVTNPITIKIYSDKDEAVLVENNIQKKKYSNQERKGSGLENIKNRYDFFTDSPVEIIETKTVFRVRLPLLEIEYD